MQDIKKRWKPYYDEKKHFLRLEQFVLFEMALMIVNRWKQDADANKGYIVFTKYRKEAVCSRGLYHPECQCLS